MNKLTPEEVKTIIAEHKTGFVPIHNCSMCGYLCGFIIYNPDMDILLYDNGCDCTGRENITQRSWYDLADHYNIQTEDKWKESVMNKFKSGAKYRG